jgi:hypothetical protein
MTNQEAQMFGISTDLIRSSYMESLTAKIAGNEMVVMSILSDCQEMLAGQNVSKNQIRQQLNIAKFILSEMMDKRRAEQARVPEGHWDC